MGPSSQEVEDAEKLEEAVFAEIFSSMVSWPGLQVASKADEEIQEVCRLLREGADLCGQWARVTKWYIATEGGSWKLRASLPSRGGWWFRGSVGDRS